MPRTHRHANQAALPITGRGRPRQTKTCKTCKKQFERKNDMNNQRWEAQKWCSPQCVHAKEVKGMKELPIEDPQWRRRAACRGKDYSLFYSVGRGVELGSETQEALRICEGCPVRQDCLNDAINWRDWSTIRGATTPVDRVELVREINGTVAYKETA